MIQSMLGFYETKHVAQPKEGEEKDGSALRAA